MPWMHFSKLASARSITRAKHRRTCAIISLPIRYSDRWTDISGSRPTPAMLKIIPDTSARFAPWKAFRQTSVARAARLFYNRRDDRRVPVLHLQHAGASWLGVISVPAALVVDAES